MCCFFPSEANYKKKFKFILSLLENSWSSFIFIKILGGKKVNVLIDKNTSLWKLFGIAFWLPLFQTDKHLSMHTHKEALRCYLHPFLPVISSDWNKSKICSSWKASISHFFGLSVSRSVGPFEKCPKSKRNYREAQWKAQNSTYP